MRNFPDFISSYAEYAKDNWCPEKFHFWSAVSVVAAALERKVWMVQAYDPRVIHYPNLYVMLVAAPGDGKTSAASRAVKFLHELTSPEGKVNFIPEQITHAALMKAMSVKKRFFVGPQEYTHSSAYFYAGEASNAMAEIKGGGDIFPLLTQAYDCDDKISKSTVARGTEVVSFPCMNVIACSTFDHLKNMLTNGGILGGFVSRFTFVVSKEQLIRTPTIMDEDLGKEDDPRSFLLLQDLQEIYGLAGRFKPDADYRKLFAKFFPDNDRARHARASEKEKAIFARKGAAIIKLSMILAASEASDLVLKGHHWVKSAELLRSLEEGYDSVIEMSHQVNTQDGIDAAIIRQVKLGNGSGMRRAVVIEKVSRSGNNRDLVTKTIVSMVNDSSQLIQDFKGGVAYLRLPG